jgi:serine/threonine protein kinase
MLLEGGFDGMRVIKQFVSNKRNHVQLCELADGQKVVLKGASHELKQELDLLSYLAFNNPHHFVSVLSHEVNPGYTYFVMEYFPEGDFLDFVDNLFEKNNFNHIIPEFILKGWFLGMCQCVDIVHSNGITHGDISPENWLAELPVGAKHDINFKLGDFGLSRLVTQPLQPEQVIGKPQYMSPEIQGGYHASIPAYDSRKSDVYSLGIILFWLLTGFMPYDTIGDTNSSFMFMFGVDAHMQGMKLLQTPSVHVTDLLSHMLHKDSTQRYSIEQVLAHEWFCASKRGDLLQPPS